MSKKSSKKLTQIDLTQFKKKLSQEQTNNLLSTLKTRFEENMSRHNDMKWSQIQARLEANSDKVRSLYSMEDTGGEPDVVGLDEESGEFIFNDCSEESPKDRRSICYDGKGQKEREKKGVFPAGNAIDMAAAMGIEILTEEQYRGLQNLGEFDLKTSSWVETPQRIRKLGGGIFCDRRYDTVFVYHNGAQSFYAARGFRGSLRV